jgi:hypothetical protein
MYCVLEKNKHYKIMKIGNINAFTIYGVQKLIFLGGRGRGRFTKKVLSQKASKNLYISFLKLICNILQIKKIKKKHLVGFVVRCDSSRDRNLSTF